MLMFVMSYSIEILNIIEQSLNQLENEQKTAFPLFTHSKQDPFEALSGSCVTTLALNNCD